jgi:hypothetical protein
MRAVDHMRLEELEVANISIATFELAHITDFLELMHHIRSLSVALGVYESEDVVALFPSVLAGEPSKSVRLMLVRKSVLLTWGTLA